MKDQKIEPYEQYVEVDHITNSIDHSGGQACCSMCTKDIVFYLGYHHFHLENWLEKTSSNDLEWYHATRVEFGWRRYEAAKQIPHPMMNLLD